jgi:hypothetical protein
MLTSHPLAATALHNGCRCRHPCLPPCRQSMLTAHPTTTTTSRDRLCPCLPPRRQSTLRIDNDVACYHRQRHARSLLLSSSPSLSLPPVNVEHPCCILPPQLPHMIVVVFNVPVPVPVPAACQRCASTLHPPTATATAIFVIVVVPVPVPVPAACQCCALTTHPPTITAKRNLHRYCCPRPCPCPCRLSTSRVNDPSYCRHQQE